MQISQRIGSAANPCGRADENRKLRGFAANLLPGLGGYAKASMRYPLAVEPAKVGTYPAEAKAGGGYVWDAVLEYRVWCHPERGAEDLHDGSVYF